MRGGGGEGLLIAGPRATPKNGRKDNYVSECLLSFLLLLRPRPSNWKWLKARGRMMTANNHHFEGIIQAHAGLVKRNNAGIKKYFREKGAVMQGFLENLQDVISMG